MISTKGGGSPYGGVGAGQWPEDLVFLYLYLNSQGHICMKRVECIL